MEACTWLGGKWMGKCVHVHIRQQSVKIYWRKQKLLKSPTYLFLHSIVDLKIQIAVREYEGVYWPR